MVVKIDSYETENQLEFDRLVKKISKLPLNRFVFSEAARIIKKFNSANFKLGGKGATGKEGETGKYPPLSERYRRRKIKLVGNKPILVLHGPLRDSISKQTGDSITIVTKESLVVGTKVFYAEYHDNPKPKNPMPQRKPLFLSTKMVDQIMKTYDQHIENGLLKA